MSNLPYVVRLIFGGMAGAAASIAAVQFTYWARALRKALVTNHGHLVNTGPRSRAIAGMLVTSGACVSQCAAFLFRVYPGPEVGLTGRDYLSAFISTLFGIGLYWGLDFIRLSEEAA